MYSHLRNLLLAVFLLSCGSNAVELTVQFANGSGVTQASNPFTDPQVADVIFTLTSQAPESTVLDASGAVAIAAGQFLDRNQDGIPDSVIYPASCDSSAAADCGFENEAAAFNIAGVSIPYRYSLTVQFRGATGTPLYQGTGLVDAYEGNTAATTIVIDKLP
jgi:hypothetical protein